MTGSPSAQHSIRASASAVCIAVSHRGSKLPLRQLLLLNDVVLQVHEVAEGAGAAAREGVLGQTVEDEAHAAGLTAGVHELPAGDLLEREIGCWFFYVK